MSPAARRRRPRCAPDRPAVPVGLAAALLLVWGAVAHASGSGWVQAVGALVTGLVLVGMLGPRLALRRLAVEVTDSDRDGTAGAPAALWIVATASCRVTPLRPGGAPSGLEARRPGRLELAPDHRGVLSAVTVRLSSAAPLGMLWWSTTRRLELPTPLVVAPAEAPHERRPLAAGDAEEAGGAAELTDAGVLRGVREYRVGDSPRQVHWPSSAHTGTLMVRESETERDRPVKVVADLLGEVEATERLASEAMGTISSLLATRRPVILETTEDGAVVVAQVADARSAGRRLARAGTNPWADLGPGSERSGRT